MSQLDDTPPPPLDGGFRTERRDKYKRTRSSNTAAGMVRDPFQLVALAVQYDERQQDETLFTEPLETTVRLYDQSQFSVALNRLQENNRKRDDPNNSLIIALTPVILSGLLSAIQQLEHLHGDDSNRAAATTTFTTSDSSSDLGSQLVASCQTLRKQALNRILRRKRRRKLQKMSLPVCALIIIMSFYWEAALHMQDLLVQLHYVDSCVNMPASEEAACRITDASLWERYHDSLLTEDSLLQYDNSLVQENGHSTAPLALHTVLRQPIVPVTLGSTNKGNLEARRSTMDQSLNTTAYPLRWMGETIITKLVRQATDKYSTSTLMKTNKVLSILDVGCGVGGLLYALMPSDTKTLPEPLSYHGITISAAEVFHAQRFLQHHNVSYMNNNIRLQQHSFDNPLDDKSAYNVVVAIESLRFSQNIDATMKNLVQSLQPGGVLIIVDDVAMSSNNFAATRLEGLGQPMVLSHSSWLEVLERNNCAIQEVRDLSLEYELMGLTSHGSFTVKHDDSASRHSSSWISLPVLWKYGHWANWLMIGGSRNAAASRRMRMLQQDQRRLELLRRKRQEEFRRVDLVYHMYVCIKK